MGDRRIIREKVSIALRPCPTLAETDKILYSGSAKATDFPIQEYWLDIGGPQEFKRAERDYGDLFER